MSFLDLLNKMGFQTKNSETGHDLGCSCEACRKSTDAGMHALRERRLRGENGSTIFDILADRVEKDAAQKLADLGITPMPTTFAAGEPVVRAFTDGEFAQVKKTWSEHCPVCKTHPPTPVALCRSLYHAQQLLAECRCDVCGMQRCAECNAAWGELYSKPIKKGGVTLRMTTAAEGLYATVHPSEDGSGRKMGLQIVADEGTTLDVRLQGVQVKALEDMIEMYWKDPKNPKESS